MGGNPPKAHDAHVPVAPGRGDTHADPWHTAPPHPRRRGRHQKHPNSGGRGLRDGERRHRGMVTRRRTDYTPHRGTRVTALARDHRTTANRGKHGRCPTGIGGQVGTRVRLSAPWAAQALPHQSHPQACPHHGRIPQPGGAPHRGLGLHAHPPPRGSRSPQERHLQPPRPRSHPHNSTQKDFTLWWHRPAPEGGLQPPADQPSISTDLTAVAHAVAAIAQQFWAPHQWAPSVIKEAGDATTQLSHTSGDAPFIHPYRTPTFVPTIHGWSTSSCPTTPRRKRGMRRQASPKSSPIPHSTTTYRRPTSLSPTTRAATTTTSTPRMSAPRSPYKPSPPVLASSHHNTTRVQQGSIHYTSPWPRAKGRPTTRPLQLTAPPSTQPADRLRHMTKTTYSHALALDPAPSPRPPTKAP